MDLPVISENAMLIESSDKKTQGDYVIIDKCDFDPKEHKEFGAKPVTVAKKGK